MPTTNSPKGSAIPVRPTPQMRQQIDELVAAGFGNQTEIIREAVSRMYKQEEKKMNANKKQFPRIIYASPVDWGNVTEYASAVGMERTIEALIDAFDEPFEGGLGDCDTYELVSLCNDGTAAYRQQHMRDNTELVIFAHADTAEYFGYVESFDTRYDDEELAALGVVTHIMTTTACQ